MSLANNRWRPSAEARVRRLFARGTRVLMTVPLVWATACAVDTPSSVEAPADSLTVSAPVTSLLLWKTMRLTVAGQVDSTSTVPTRWTSSDSNILRVDSMGWVTARSLGTVTVTARRGELVGRRELSVVLQRVNAEIRMLKGAAGYATACAIAVSGAPYCMRHTGVVDSIPVFSLQPSADGIVFISFSTALDSNCGLDTNGQGWCWGRSSHGIFGTGTIGPAATTAPAPLAGSLRFKELVINGHSQVCGINRADDVLYCWGHNDGAQLGRGPAGPDMYAPGPVVAALRAIDVATSNWRTCAIDLQGAPWCWGQTFRGPPEPQFNGAPSRLEGAPQFRTVTLGERHACALTQEGAAWCWGANANGQLGTGAPADYSAPAPVVSGLRFETIEASELSTCGVSSAGDVYCWGTSPFRLTRSGDVRSVFHGRGRLCIIKRDDTMWCT
jgi:hypothetical protein